MAHGRHLGDTEDREATSLALFLETLNRGDQGLLVHINSRQEVARRYEYDSYQPVSDVLDAVLAIFQTKVLPAVVYMQPIPELRFQLGTLPSRRLDAEGDLVPLTARLPGLNSATIKKHSAAALKLATAALCRLNGQSPPSCSSATCSLSTRLVTCSNFSLLWSR